MNVVAFFCVCARHGTISGEHLLYLMLLFRKTGNSCFNI